MALKTVIESLDGIDDAVKPFYAETDGKFVLQVEGIDTHPEVANLKSAYERVKGDKTNAAQKLKDMEAQLAEMSKGKPDEAKLVKEREALEAKIAELDKAKADAEARYLSVTRDRALDEALSSAGIKEPAFIKASRAMLAGMVKMDGDKPIVETDMGPKGLSDFVKQWAAGEGKAFIAQPSGGGAKGNDSGDKAATKPGALAGSPDQRRQALAARFPELKG